LLVFLVTIYATAFARQPIRYRSGRSIPLRKIYWPTGDLNSTQQTTCNKRKEANSLDIYPRFLNKQSILAIKVLTVLEW